MDCLSIRITNKYIFLLSLMLRNVIRIHFRLCRYSSFPLKYTLFHFSIIRYRIRLVFGSIKLLFE